MKKQIPQRTCSMLLPAICKVFIINGNMKRFSLKTSVVPILLTSILLFSVGCSKPTNTLPQPVTTIPSVSTLDVTVISQTTGMSGGFNFEDLGGAQVLERGICWSTTINPTIANFKKNAAPGAGWFFCAATGLTAGTTYYVRAYAINSAGVGYGNEINFTTSQVSTTTVTDIDGNIYNTITIGTQVWMSENLKTTHYQNGDDIPMGLSDGGWQYHNSQALGACAVDLYYAGGYNDVYGKLYNWFAVVDPRKIAPDGWHVPTEKEWNTLTSFLGGSNTAGVKIKEAGLSHWVSPNTGATNSSGFTGLPGGYRDTNGACDFIGNKGWWWSTTESAPGSDEAEALGLFSGMDEANIVNGKKGFGVSVRCIKD